MGVSYSGVAALVVLPTSYIHYTCQGTSGSLECASTSSLQHLALSRCATGSTAKQQSSPGRMGCHSPLHRFLLPLGTPLQPRCKSEVRYGRQPAFRATGATHLRLSPRCSGQCRGSYWQSKAELPQLQAPCSLPENS